MKKYNKKKLKKIASDLQSLLASESNAPVDKASMHCDKSGSFVGYNGVRMSREPTTNLNAT